MIAPLVSAPLDAMLDHGELGEPAVCANLDYSFIGAHLDKPSYVGAALKLTFDAVRSHGVICAPLASAVLCRGHRQFIFGELRRQAIDIRATRDLAFETISIHAVIGRPFDIAMAFHALACGVFKTWLRSAARKRHYGSQHDQSGQPEHGRPPVNRRNLCQQSIWAKKWPLLARAA